MLPWGGGTSDLPDSARSYSSRGAPASVVLAVSAKTLEFIAYY